MKQQTAILQRAGAWAAVVMVLAMGTLFGGTSAQEVLPAPPAPFQGQIGLSAKDSKSDFPKPVQAPKGAPNIVVVLLDDVGFGASSAFGGPIATPTSIGWRRAGCATPSSTPRRCVRPRGRRS